MSNSEQREKGEEYEEWFDRAIENLTTDYIQAIDPGSDTVTQSVNCYTLTQCHIQPQKVYYVLFRQRPILEAYLLYLRSQETKLNV